MRSSRPEVPAGQVVPEDGVDGEVLLGEVEADLVEQVGLILAMLVPLLTSVGREAEELPGRCRHHDDGLAVGSAVRIGVGEGADLAGPQALGLLGGHARSSTSRSR